MPAAPAVPPHLQCSSPRRSRGLRPGKCTPSQAGCRARYRCWRTAPPALRARVARPIRGGGGARKQTTFIRQGWVATSIHVSLHCHHGQSFADELVGEHKVTHSAGVARGFRQARGSALHEAACGTRSCGYVGGRGCSPGVGHHAARARIQQLCHDLAGPCRMLAHLADPGRIAQGGALGSERNRCIRLDQGLNQPRRTSWAAPCRLPPPSSSALRGRQRRTGRTGRAHLSPWRGDQRPQAAPRSAGRAPQPA